MFRVGLFAVSACVLAIASGLAAPAFAAGEAHTTYTFNGPSTIDASTCGSTGTVQGCFPVASLNGLNGPCSMLEGASTATGVTTTQELFILETGSDAAPIVTLKVYKKVVTIQSNTIITSITLQKSRNILSLRGGSNLTCYMAANAGSIFLGTNAGTRAVQLNKKNFVGHPFGRGLPPGKLAGITANEAGYVTVFFGGNNRAFYLFGPDGKSLEFGGAANPIFIPNLTNGVKLN